MLKYEEKLHFDERYKKLQTCHTGTKPFSLLWCIVSYTLAFFLLHWLQTKIPDVYAWNIGPAIYNMFGIRLHTSDLIYYILGLLMMSYGVLCLIDISKENHKANHKGNHKGNNKPTHLINTGHYARVRHPMYGAFIFMYSSLAFSIHSVIGLILAFLIIAGQYVNAYFEESHTLIPLFQGEYRKYQKATPELILTKWQIAILSLLYVITLIGYVKFL